MADLDPVHNDEHRRISEELHRRINQRQDVLWAEAKAAGAAHPFQHEGWLYQIRTGLYERKRLALLFKAEREGKLPTRWKMCAHDPSPAANIREPGLRCAIGVRTTECPYLQALFGEPLPGADSELIDQLKADVCTAHVQQHQGAHPHFYCDGSFMDDGTAELFNERMARSFGAEF
jgi:hypothetical protein